MEQELERRVQLLIDAKDHPKLQAVEKEACKLDILYFFNNYLYTERNSTFFSNDIPSIIPFIPFEFQIEYITEVWESIVEGNKPVNDRKPWVLTDVFIEKSRQMGISWLTCWIYLYGFLFHGHKYTMISRTESEVDKSGDMDSLFEKIRFMIRSLPDWMLPNWFSKSLGKNSTNAHMILTNPETSASITGKTANPDAGRWGTRNSIFMDEMASMQYATAICKAAGHNSPCLIFNSTPNGRGNEFYRKRLLTMTRNENGQTYLSEIKWLRYHWSDHPIYDDERYREKVKGKSKEEIAQELEIDYDTAIVWRVYDMFPTESSTLVYNPEKPMYVWIDNSHWWPDPNAIIVMQPEEANWNILDTVEVWQPPEYCAEFLTCQPRFAMNYEQDTFLDRYRNYNWRKAIFVSDPYDTKSAMWSSTILDDYKKVGINLFLPSERSKKEQITKTRTNIHRIRYTDRCLDFAWAILNARYPEIKEWSNRTSDNNNPVHDYTSHYRTALEYWVTYMLENPSFKKRRVLEDTRPKRNLVTWQLIYHKS